MKYYTKYRFITFLYFLLLFAIIEISISIFNVDSFYIRILIILPFVLVLQKPYENILNTMSQKKTKTFEKSCKVIDIEDYVRFVGLRSKRIYSKPRRYKSLYYFYLYSFYTYNNEFLETEKLLEFLSVNEKYNITKIQVLNTEMLKETIKGEFQKVEDLYIELCYSLDIEIDRYDANSKEVTLLNQIRIVLGKFVELTKEVNEETISNARLWINTKSNLHNSIDNYCIIKILEYHNDTIYIEEFKNNIRNIDGDIPFLKIDLYR